MTVVLAVLVAVLVVDVALRGWQTRRPKMLSVIDERVRDSVIVTAKDGSAWRGVLWQADSVGIVLRSVSVLMAAPSAPTPVDGELLVLLADIAYIQRP